MDNLNFIIGHFLIGLTGGFGHCVLMCHPFVLHISSVFSESNTGYRILIPNLYYNIGRTFTYSLLGAIAGALGSVATYAGAGFLNIQKSAAIIGGSILIVFALLYLFNISSLNILAKLPIIKGMKKVSPKSPFLYGILLGFLPCGLSMGAVIGSISGETWQMGAMMMAAFGIGTTFSMMFLAVLGSFVMRYTHTFKNITAVLLLCMGIYSVYKGITFHY